MITQRAEVFLLGGSVSILFFTYSCILIIYENMYNVHVFMHIHCAKWHINAYNNLETFHYTWIISMKWSAFHTWFLYHYNIGLSQYPDPHFKPTITIAIQHISYSNDWTPGCSGVYSVDPPFPFLCKDLSISLLILPE